MKWIGFLASRRKPSRVKTVSRWEIENWCFTGPKFGAFAIRSACRFRRQDRAASGTLQKHVSFGTHLILLRKEPTGWWDKVFTDYIALTKKKEGRVIHYSNRLRTGHLDGRTLFIGLEVAEKNQITSLAILCWESFDTKSNCHMLNKCFI